jgi:hypothetical protein
LAWLELWRVDHLIVDSAGVGEGMFDYLCAILGTKKVTGYDFQGRGKKAALGSSFVSLVETGRFKYWSRENEDGMDAERAGELPQSDGWWFWSQVAGCQYDLPPGGQFDRDLRWGVPAGATVPTASGSERLHDDRLLSAALVALADKLRQGGRIRSGRAKSAIIQPRDPLERMRF